MARMPRLLVPGQPHHVTQWGNRRMKTFFNAGDYQAYLDLVAKVKGDTGVEVWARLWTLPQDWGAVQRQSAAEGA